VTVIDRKTIENSHAENIVDVLKGQANIVVRDTSGTGAKAIVDLGGYGDTASSNKVVLIDGRRISSPDLAEADWTQIPLGQIERIEIMHGGGSVLYGDGAVGGVINIITRIPETGGQVSVGGGSYGSTNGHARIGADTGKVQLGINYAGSKTDGYRKNSKLERYDAGGNFEVDISEHLQWYGSSNLHRDRVGLPGALSPAQVAADPRQTLTPNEYGDTTDSFINTGLLLNWRSVELDLPASFQRRESVGHFSWGASSSLLRTKSLRPKFNWHVDIAGGEMGVIAGADLDRVDGLISGLNATRDRKGYYGVMNFTDSAGRYTFSGGIRSEKVADALKDGSSAISNTLSAYDLGATFALGDFHIRLNHNRSIRLPKLDERVEYLFPLFTPSFRTNLLPQTGRHYNASVRYQGDKQWIEMSYQQADLTHEIFLDPTIGFFGTNSNYLDPTRHQVVMLAASWRANDILQLTGNYTYTRATFQGGSFNGKFIPGVPRNRLGLQWQADWAKGLSTTISSTYVGKSYLLNDQLNALAQLNAYWLIDVAASYKMDAVEVFARIDNATNRKYVTTGAVSPSSGAIGLYPASEIAVRGGVSYRF
jgi:outer membrane cobalamin receptor